MKQPNFTSGVVIALVAAISGAVLFTLLSTLLNDIQALQLLITLGTVIYLIYLIKASRGSVGRVITLVSWTAISAIAWFSELSLPLYLWLQVMMIWLVRSLYFYSRLLPALADLGLNFLAVAAAYWVLVQTHSIGLTIWSFFLTQALFTFIADGNNKKAFQSEENTTTVDRFYQAHLAAQAAVKKLSAIH